MSNNSSKQVLLSVIGVAILVVAVVGVSFAFFTYSRTGESNNKITTGTLVFNFVDGDTITLTNHFPITTAEGTALSGENNVCTFTIEGNTSTGSIAYTVSAVTGDTIADKTRLKDSEVFLQIKSTDVTGISWTPTTGYDTGKAITALPLQLGTGSVTATAKATRTFEVRMWVDSSVVTIGESGTYTTEEYGNLYYSMKIKVEANA